jgi:hypothetical protein
MKAGIVWVNVVTMHEYTTIIHDAARHGMTQDIVASARPVRLPGVDILGAKTDLPPDVKTFEAAAVDLALHRALGDPRLGRDIGTGQQGAAIRRGR